MQERDTDFQELYNRYRPRLLRYLGRLVGEQEAPDLLQEVFLRIDKAYPSFRGESSLDTWVYRIARHAALDRLRSRSFRQPGVGSLPLPADAAREGRQDEYPSEGGNTFPVERQAIRKEMSECVRDLVESLPDRQRSVLALSEFEEMTDCEVAERLGQSKGAVKIRLHRARARLRKELESRCVFHRDDRNVLACDRKKAP